MTIRRWFITLLTVALAAGFTGGAMAGPPKDPGGGGGGGKSCNSGERERIRDGPRERLRSGQLGRQQQRRRLS